jgi:hypothetical protein
MLTPSIIRPLNDELSGIIITGNRIITCWITATAKKSLVGWTQSRPSVCPKEPSAHAQFQATSRALNLDVSKKWEWLNRRGEEERSLPSNCTANYTRMRKGWISRGTTVQRWDSWNNKGAACGTVPSNQSGSWMFSHLTGRISESHYHASQLTSFSWIVLYRNEQK